LVEVLSGYWLPPAANNIRNGGETPTLAMTNRCRKQFRCHAHRKIASATAAARGLNWPKPPPHAVNVVLLRCLHIDSGGVSARLPLGSGFGESKARGFVSPMDIIAMASWLIMQLNADRWFSNASLFASACGVRVLFLMNAHSTALSNLHLLRSGRCLFSESTLHLRLPLARVGPPVCGRLDDPTKTFPRRRLVSALGKFVETHFDQALIIVRWGICYKNAGQKMPNDAKSQLKFGVIMTPNSFRVLLQAKS